MTPEKENTGGNINKENTSRDEGSGRYAEVVKQDLWDFIHDQPQFYTKAETPWTEQLVFDIRYGPNDTPLDHPIAIRWLTTVEEETGESEPIGQNAMQVVPIDQVSKRPLQPPKRVYRVEDWEDNLEQKINLIHGEVIATPSCPNCDRPLIIVTNDKKKFRGCSGYYTDDECGYSQKYNPQE